MSTINVTNLSGRGGATPNLPDGANVTGVCTAGALRIGTGGTVGPVGSGIVTYYGDGANLTGVGETIAPHYYNPSVGNQDVTVHTGIGITFNKKIDMGSGTATLKIVNAGVAGTTVQSWGISSVTQGAVTEFTLNSIITTLVKDTTYQVDIPEGFVVDSNETSYAGTAYTFTTKPSQKKMWAWGYGTGGALGQGTQNHISSPVQIPGTWDDTYGTLGEGYLRSQANHFAIKQDGTLWSWGQNGNGGRLGQNNLTSYDSPVQIGSGTDWKQVSKSYLGAIATKTNGTLWAWGNNQRGQLGQNSVTNPSNMGISSPVQIPGTSWTHGEGGLNYSMALRTDGTLWAFGSNTYGELGDNSRAHKSSPVQIPGTTWTKNITAGYYTMAVKTDGTLYAWGSNTYGALGLNQPHPTKRSSPTQIPGTTWSTIRGNWAGNTFGLKTDSTAWAWGDGRKGAMGLNEAVQRSSPTQIPGSWTKISASEYGGGGIKTGGSMWTWGGNSYGEQGQNDTTQRSSPIQVGTDTEWTNMSPNIAGWIAIQDDQSV